MLRLSNFLNIKKYFLFYTSQTIPKNRLACYLKPKPNHFLDNISVKVSHPNRWKPLSITVTVMESAFLEELREGSHFFHLQTGADVRAYARSTRHPKDLKQNRMKNLCLYRRVCVTARDVHAAEHLVGPSLCASHIPHTPQERQTFPLNP